MSSGLIVFAHGSRDPFWAETLEALRTRIEQALPACSVELAYLEFMQPSLDACVETLWRRGCRDLSVLPAFVAAGAHLRAELPQLIRQAGRGRDTG